ncbi:MAG: protein translocase subunit SecD [Coriobacteriia bacterium]|nr:protein translocase subunit SecD [Coriobacteriia bacterium]
MDAKQKNYIALAALVLLLAASFWSFWPPQTNIRQGLDLQGGLSVILTADRTKATPEAMSRALTIINNRVNSLGVSEATVQREGENSILIQLPGVRDPRGALKALGTVGQLEFVEVSSLPATIQAGIQDGTKLKKGTYEAALRGDVVVKALAAADSQRPGAFEVQMTFNATGAQKWAEITQRSIGKRIAIVLDGVVQSAPTVQSVIPDGVSSITGSFTGEQANRLAAVLESGALPIDLKFSETQSVGPTLGQDSLRQGVLAAAVGVALVGLYLAIYYRAFGVVAWFSLGSFILLYLGVLATLSRAGYYALSLPGVAGIVLSIGLAADTSILIFERFREEIAMGKSPRTAAKSGTRHAILTSLDADMVTFASAIPLAAFAIGTVKGFAITLMIGIICDLTVAVLFTIPVVKMLAEGVVGRMPAVFGVKGGAV